MGCYAHARGACGRIRASAINGLLLYFLMMAMHTIMPASVLTVSQTMKSLGTCLQLFDMNSMQVEQLDMSYCNGDKRLLLRFLRWTRTLSAVEEPSRYVPPVV